MVTAVPPFTEPVALGKAATYATRHSLLVTSAVKADEEVFPLAWVCNCTSSEYPLKLSFHPPYPVLPDITDPQENACVWLCAVCGVNTVNMESCGTLQISELLVSRPVEVPLRKSIPPVTNEPPSTILGCFAIVV